MPRPFALLAAAAALTLGACASTGTQTAAGGGPSELARLRTDCEARGGFLQPTGRLEGRPELDNYCRITGGASRLP